MTISSVILAGGKSSRMGENKAQLRLEGIRFIDRIFSELSALCGCFVSVDDPALHTELSDYRLVGDIFPGCGPLAGLHAALKSTDSNALLAVSCDLPLFDRELGKYLISRLDGWEAVVPVTADGRKNPLCAVYTKRCAEVFERGLRGGKYSVMTSLDGINVRYIPLDEKYSGLLRNINTPEDYQTLMAGERTGKE